MLDFLHFIIPLAISTLYNNYLNLNGTTWPTISTLLINMANITQIDYWNPVISYFYDNGAQVYNWPAHNRNMVHFGCVGTA